MQDAFQSFAFCDWWSWSAEGMLGTEVAFCDGALATHGRCAHARHCTPSDNPLGHEPMLNTGMRGGGDKARPVGVGVMRPRR